MVSRRTVTASRSLLGLGVNEDWSFERAFLEINDVPCCCVDGSVSLHRFAAEARLERLRALKALMRLRWAAARRAHREADRLATLHESMNEFFGRSGCSLISEYVGPASWRRLDWRQLVSVHSTAIFVKCDIEGAEYRLLPELASDAGRLAGLVVEFHDVDLHLRHIEAFCSNVQNELVLVHLHANNCQAPIVNATIPPVLELTWAARHLFLSSEIQTRACGELPLRELDQPNDPKRCDFKFAWG